MNMRPLRAVATAAVLTLGLTACGGGGDAGGGDAGGADAGGGTADGGGTTDGGTAGGGGGAELDLVTDGTLTVCSDVPYAPFEDFDPSTESGYTGFDIEIVEAIAEGLDLELAVKDSSFDGLQSGLSLNAGECDLAASAMTITEDRQANLAFSDGYYDSKQSLLVPADSEIQGIDDLEGARVGVQQGTTGEAYAEENAAGAELIAFPSDAEMYQAILAGQVDALLQDLPVNLVHTEDGDFTIVEEYATDETYGLAMRKDNTALVEAVNAELQELRDDGTYDELYAKYFTVEGGDGDSATGTGR